MAQDNKRHMEVTRETETETIDQRHKGAGQDRIRKTEVHPWLKDMAVSGIGILLRSLVHVQSAPTPVGVHPLYADQNEAVVAGESGSCSYPDTAGSECQ